MGRSPATDTATITTMDMDTSRRLLYLLQIANASFPTGAFNHSFGFETWIDAGEITSAAELELACRDWLSYGVRHGDAAIVAHAHRAANAADLEVLDQVAAAIKLSRETRGASMKMGWALLNALHDVFDVIDLEDYARSIQEGSCEGHYAVIFGAAAACIGVAESDAVLVYLHTSLANVTSVAARLIPLGQIEVQRIIWRSHPFLLESTAAAQSTDLHLIGTATVGLDVASMQHERLHTRLCMS
jgi:urease accessory protein